MTIVEGVNIAKSSDADRVYNFLLNLNNENAIFPLSESRSREAIASCLPQTQGLGGIIGIIENQKEIEACVGLRFSRMWYTDEWFLDELWNFVLPEYRKSTNAQKLIDFAKKVAEMMNTPLVMGIVTQKQLEPKMRLYQRKMKQVGAYFISGKEFDNMFQQRKL